MKQYCKNCGRSVRNPRSKTWDQGYCPKCHYEPWVTALPKYNEIVNKKGGKTPVDMYWHLLALRAVTLDEYP